MKYVREICKRHEEQTLSIIEKFLIPYSAVREKYERRFQYLYKKYRHIIKRLPDEWESIAMIQLIAHTIFKKDGRLGVRRYLIPDQ